MPGTTPITQDFIDELKVLACFDSSNLHQGIKLHKESPAGLHAAALRLHQRGLIEEQDGGYLTAFGRTQVEHLQHLLTALRLE